MSKRFGLLAQLKRTLSSRRGAKRSPLARPRQFRFESLETRQVLSGLSPFAASDAAATLVGQSVTVDVLANDSDADGDLDPASLAIVPTATPAHGSVSIDATTHRLVYTPVAGYYGEDSFRYTVSDLLGNVSNQATVTIQIDAKPVANNDSVTIEPGKPVTIAILANDTDADGDLSLATVEIIPAAGTEYGTMTFDTASRQVTYTPKGKFYHADSFQYVITDSKGFVSNTATVTINVKPEDRSAFADVGEEVVIPLLTELTDGAGNPLRIRVTNAPDHGYWSIDGGTVRYTPDGDFTGKDSFGYRIVDSQNNQSSEGTVTITYADYDKVDLLRKTSQNPTTGNLWYHLETINPGTLTAEAVFALSGGNIEMTLYELKPGANPESFNDSDLVELTVQNRRIDWSVDGRGEHYFLKLSGTNSNVDLRLANVFNRDVAGAATEDPHKSIVYGTDGDDKLEISPSDVIITDVGEGFSIRYSIDLTAKTGTPPQLRPVEFDGGAGTNSVVVTGDSTNETVDVARTADSVTMTGLPFSPVLKGVSSVTVAGGGGNDTILLHGTSAEETFTNSDNPTLESSAMKIIATDFDTIQVDTDQSTDLAKLFGSTGDDELVASPAATTLTRSDGYTVVLNGFKTINVTSLKASTDYDKAVLTGSDADDTFTGDAKNDLATLVCAVDSEWKITVTGFDEVAATAVAGGTDTATFIDSSGDDTFTGTSAESSLKRDDVYWYRALSFPAVTVTSSTGGSDTANLEGSSGDETYLFDAKLNEATLKPAAGDSYSIKVAKFAKVTVDGKGGTDTATLTDSAGEDTFTVTAKDQKASLSGSGFLTEVVAFATITAEAKEGGTDKAVLTGTDGDDTFKYEPAAKTGTLTANGTYEVKAFDDVTVDAVEGSDQIELVDSSANETLTLKPAGIDFSGSGVTIHTQNFEHTPGETGFVFAFSAYSHDSDTVVIKDGEGDDKFQADRESTKYFAGGATDPLYTASGFQIVTFDATAGSDDTDQASILGSDAEDVQDTFEIWSNKATVTTRDLEGIVSKVEYNFTGLAEVSADAQSGTDILTLHDSQGDDTLTLKPGTIDLSGTGYLIHLLDFEPSGQSGEFVFDFSTVADDSDTVHIYDGDGNDVFRAGPTWAKFAGSGARYSTLGFREVFAHATAGGNDTAWLMDSTGDDTFTASPTEAKLEGTLNGGSFTLTASGFDVVKGCSASGNDTAILKGSDGNDTATLASGAELRGDSFTSQAFGFETVKFEAGNGTDTLRLWDSAGNDALTAKPQEITFTRSDCTVTATQCEVLSAHGDLYGDDQDTASLEDTDGNDTLTATPGAVTLTGQSEDGWTKIDFAVNSFSKVTVVSTFGDDTATFIDSEMNDTLTVTPDQVDFSNQEFAVTAKVFDRIRADASTESGDLDVANLAGSASDDTFEVRDNKVTCVTNVGGYLRLDYDIASFHTVTIDAKEGNDTVNFHGSAKNDTLTAKPTQVDFVTDGYTVTAKNFDHVVADAGDTAGGDDVANLYDTTGDDTLTASPTQVQLTGNSADDTTKIDFLAKSFGKVYVFGSSAIEEDIANLTGSDGDDTFEGSAEKSKLSGSGYAIEVSKFNKIYVTATGGNDTATFTDSAGDDTFTAKPEEATLSGENYSVKVSAFDAVHATSKNGGNDTAEFFGSTGSDTFTGKAEESTMSVPGCTYTATKFQKVLAHGEGGTDTANLYDYVYSEVLDLKKERASLFGHFKDGRAFNNEVLDFDQVNAYQTQGHDYYKKEAVLDYNFTLFGIWPLQS